MSSLPPDPLASGGVAEYGKRLRRGEITAEAATQAYLARIEILDRRLGAYEHVASGRALATAQSIDRLLSSGIDLGPLMGVPVAVKDLFAIDGMPTTAGSNLDVSDIIGPEGSFIKALKRAGCIILGKTKTDEFALGTLGLNPVRGTPWNPWDATTHRAPGGSSSGSAVAVAAGLCAFAIGTDTGGSVRGPAAFCGVTGLKTTAGLWPTDGFCPLSTTMDTIGPLTKTAADAAIVFAGLTGQKTSAAKPLRSLRLGKPINYFYDDMDSEVKRCVVAALCSLAEAGVEIVPVEVPEADECTEFNSTVSPAELLATLGRERFLAARHMLGDVVVASALRGLEVMADEYVQLLTRHRELRRIAEERMMGFDGWVTPTRQRVPMPVAEIATRESRTRMERMMLRNTRPANTFGICAMSTPIQKYGSALPVGLQIICPPYQEARALSIALAIEGMVGAPPPPDLTGFL